MHEFAIIIGRCQPFHNAHREIVRCALTKANKVIIVLGSANQARTIKNPWTTDERISMIKACAPDLGQDALKRIFFIPAKDYLYNDNMWLIAVQEKIGAITNGSKDIVLMGHKKDRSSFYLNLFPQWKFHEVGELQGGIDATRVRQHYFHRDLEAINKIVPEQVASLLTTMMNDENGEFSRLQEEYQHITDYLTMWDETPFPPTFVTTDCVVIKSGHVLVVRRKFHPGKGLIALPGGYLKSDERIIEGAIRELKEETKIRLPKDELKARIVDQNVFDHPGRSMKGRTITHAFCINLGHGDLPEVQGEDDADRAWWMPLRDVFAREEEFFEDHFHIISYFANRF